MKKFAAIKLNSIVNNLRHSSKGCFEVNCIANTHFHFSIMIFIVSLCASFPVHSLVELSKLYFRHQFIYFEAITTMLCDAQWKTTHEIYLLPSESLMHASHLLWPTHSGECNKRAQINNKILAYNEMNEEFMALWQIERERIKLSKDEGMCWLSACFGLPLQPKLIWMFLF